MLYVVLSFFVALSLALAYRLYGAQRDLNKIKATIEQNGDLIHRYPNAEDSRYAPAVRDMVQDMRCIEEIVQ